jgi:GH24 family phage-related lysozyme (muramidase)
MPVRYDIASQVPQIGGGIDPLNMMAQLRQQQMSEAQLARMAQSMDVQDFQAQIAAQRELRQAEAAQRQAGLYGAQQQEAEQKVQAGKVDLYRNMFDKFVNDQQSLDHFVSLMEKDFPQGVAAFKGKKFSDDWKQSLINPAGDYMEAGGEVYKKSARGLTPAPILQPSAEGMPGPRQDLATSLIREREGFQPTGKWDVNANRAGYGSDTVTLPDGTVQKITKGMQVSEADAERDLQRRIQTEFVPKAAAKVGEENWARLPENTRAALTSIAYNYGTIPSRLVPAVQSGNTEEIAKAIEGLASDNKGVNAGRRMQEANIARGTTMPGSAAVPAFAAAGAPTFMGGPQIQPPINMMAAPPMPPANAMTAPALPPPPAPVQPTQPLTVGTKTLVKGQNDVEKTLDKMMTAYAKLNELKAIPSTERTFGENLGAYAAGTTFGQEVEKMRATPAQKQRNELKSLRRMLLEDIKKATGASSKEMDSNFELKNVLESLSDETQDIDSVRRIVADLSARYGLGRVAAPAEAAPATGARPPLSSFYAR